MAGDPLIGQVLHDTHEVIRLIGKGGMGSVYEARHVHLNKSFAVKVLDPRFAENETIFARFKREALISSSLGHPAIVQVSDFYIHDDGRPCMVMEYLEGKDLGVVLKERKCLPPEEVVEIVEQVAGALQAVHERDIVHRDMKPGNIFLVDHPGGMVQAKVLDFGISKFKNPDDGIETLTTSQTILGTPHFMSPEQALGEVGDVDWRTDIFALATICYYALSGKLPFNAPSLHGVLVKIQTMEPPPITGLVAGLSGRAHLALQKAMAKDKAHRFERVEAFAAELKAGLAVPAADDQRDRAGEPEFATLVEANVEAPEGDASLEAVAGPPGPSEQPAEDPHMTNVVPLDELLGEVGQAEEAGEDEGGTAAAPAASTGGEASPVEDEQAPDVPEPAASPVVLEALERVEDVEASAAPVKAEPSAVSPHTTLSGSAGEMPTEEVKPAAGRKPLPVKAMAAAAVLVLVMGGAYMLLRGTGGAPGPGNGEPDVVAAAPVAPAPSAIETPDEPQEQQPSREAAPVQEPAGTNQPPPAPEVRITLELSPPGAEVFLDGKATADNPLLLKKDDKPHRLRVAADGHEPHEQDLVASADRVLKVELQETRPATVSEPMRRRATATRSEAADWEDPFKKQRKPPRKMKKARDEAFTTLEAPKPKPRKKKKEEAFDSL